MATDDQQVLVAGVATAPATFRIPGNGQITPRAVFAHYDGTGAATPFLPALKITSDGGELVGIYPACSSVAAGGSADLSWFPDVACCPTAATTGANYNAVVGALGPWAYWKLSEPVGAATVADSSGHGRTLTVDPQVTLGQPGLLPTDPTQTCALVNWTAATNVYSFPSVANQTFGASVLTIEVWLKTPGHAPNELALSAHGRLDTERTWLLTLNNSGQPVFSFIDAGAVVHTLTLAAAFDDNVAHQLVVVMDGTNVRLYKDGVQVDTQLAGGALNTPATHGVYIGQPPGGAGSRSYSGDIGPVVVYDQALTGAQVATLYNNGAATLSAGAVASVTAGDTSIVIGGTATDPTVETASLDVIATDHPPAANWSNNSKKITSLANGSAAQDAAAFGQIPTSLPPSGAAGGDLAGTYPNPTVAKLTETGGPTDLTIGSIPDGDLLKRSGSTIVGQAAGGGTVTSVTAGDTSIVIGGTATDPTVETASLDVIATDHPPAANWSNNSKKITSVADPTLAQDAATKNYVDGNFGGFSVNTYDVNDTYTMPANAVIVDVVCIGAGGGGGWGNKNDSTTSGGGGGGGGAVTRAIIRATDISSPVTVTVGVGGAGNVGGAGSGSGANGGGSSFGSYLFAGGGGGGAQGSGTTTTSAGGGGGSVIATAATTTAGAPSSATAIGGQAATAASGANGNNAEWGGASGGGSPASSGVGKPGGSSIMAGAGGGAGASKSSAAGNNGGDGGKTQSYTAGGGGAAGVSGASGTCNGTDGTSWVGPFCGTGGGGGATIASGAVGTAGTGGKGGIGCGGGGGGCSRSTGGTPGNGGDGGHGRVIVTTFF